eukprot:TRINITY_DN3173_c0_g1_i1.p3 TRINITY_DN3173_c0_g1~~TRINITY_DN3173_c0_g1_i1.p3  ORF type:complete len:105 (+),score=21.21 TRINITY_DN3173_c0_g1_i1:327-641(+)
MGKHAQTLEEDLNSLKDFEKYPIESNDRNILLVLASEKNVLKVFQDLASEVLPLFDITVEEVRKKKSEFRFKRFRQYIEETVEVLIEQEQMYQEQNGCSTASSK